MLFRHINTSQSQSQRANHSKHKPHSQMFVPSFNDSWTQTFTWFLKLECVEMFNLYQIYNMVRKCSLYTGICTLVECMNLVEWIIQRQKHKSRNINVDCTLIKPPNETTLLFCVLWLVLMKFAVNSWNLQRFWAYELCTLLIRTTNNKSDQFTNILSNCNNW